MMLEQLLRSIAQGGIHSYQDLAQQLSISQPMLEAGLEDLARLGYLRSLDDGCGEQCSACPVGHCSVTGPGRLWSLTEKGGRAATRLSS
jgi:DNA-binding IscR family transcriptional regulator